MTSQFLYTLDNNIQCNYDYTIYNEKYFSERQFSYIVRILTWRAYRIAGNFRGVLIFIIFVVDLAVAKFSYPRKLMPMVESTMMGVAKNIVHDHGSVANTSQQQ